MTDKNFIINSVSRAHYWQGEGLCSIKTFSQGEAFYKVENNRIRVDQHSFLILNNKTNYTIEIEHDQPVHSFCIFFSTGLLKDVYNLQTRSAAFLLDNPVCRDTEQTFFERTYPISLLESSLFRSFRKMYPLIRNEEMLLSEYLVQLLQTLPAIQKQTQKELSGLQLKKHSSKQEVYRRLNIAREYLHAHIYQRVTLEELGSISFLSLNHLVRYFRQAFGITPHQYFTRLKMTKAKELLASTGINVHALASLLGYESVSSFSLLYKRTLGASPQSFIEKR